MPASRATVVRIDEALLVVVDRFHGDAHVHEMLEAGHGGAAQELG